MDVGNGITRNVILIAVSLAVVGVLVGVTPAIYGALYEEPMLTGTQEEILNQKQADATVSPEEQARQNKEQKNNIVRNLVFLAPYVGLIFGAGAGVVAALRVSGGTRNVVVTAGLGSLVGVIAFVVLTIAVAGFTWAPIPMGGSGLTATHRIAQVEYGRLITNAIGVGIIGAIVAVATAFFTDRIGE